MTALAYFRTEWDWSTDRVTIQLDADSANVILGNRNLFEPGAVQRIWNWVGAGNWLYRDYHGRAAGTDADTYASFMKTNYTIMWDFRANGFVIDLNGVPPRKDLWPHRYDTGLYATLANARDSWSADFKSFVTTFLSTH